jgi:hypothetical protein
MYKILFIQYKPEKLLQQDINSINDLDNFTTDDYDGE